MVLPSVRPVTRRRVRLRLRIPSVVIPVVLSLVAIFVASHFRSTTYNNYVRLGDGILHGHLWIEWPGRIIDAAEYQGHHYGVDGPFPVLFVLPFVFFKGLQANQTLPASILGALDVGLV